jgi:hypothetical protein
MLKGAEQIADKRDKATADIFPKHIQAALGGAVAVNVSTPPREPGGAAS